MENNTDVIQRFYRLYPVEYWKAVGFYNDKYIDVINQYWLQFDPPNRASNYSLAILYIIIMCFGCFGNAFVVFLYFRNKELKTSGNVLIVNLAISDFLMLLKTPIFVYNSFSEGPALGDIACRLYGFVGGLTGTVSICTLGTISVDRFYVIKYPLNRSFNNLRVKICLIVVWIYGLTFSIIPSLNIGLGNYTPEGYLTSCSFDYLSPSKGARIFLFIYFIAAWVVPFTVISFCYFNIMMVVLKRGSATKKKSESFRHIKEEDKRKQEFKLSLIVLCVIFLWFAAWTPYAVVALLGISGNKNFISQLGSMIPALFCKSASALDPYVYALSHPKFKKELIKVFKRNGLTQNPNKIWNISKPPKRNFEETTDQVSEVETVELASTSQVKIVTDDSKVPIKNGDEEVLKKKKDLSLAEMICFRPSFSNRTSSIRKIARRYSLKN